MSLGQNFLTNKKVVEDIIVVAEGKERLENLQEWVTIARRYDKMNHLDIRYPSGGGA